MKKLLMILTVGAAFGFAFMNTNADQDSEGKNLPAVSIKDVEGNAFNTGDLENDGKPMVISFWATWCKPCKLELNTIQEVYQDWQDETGVKLVAVSIDNERTKNMVKPYVNSSGWDYEVLMDVNGDFKRAMGVNNVPHTFLVDKNGKIVYSHSGFVPGDEEILFEHIEELLK
ncbi:TlpA family protein disulfide reductase [Putridiphycobacter roseus]|uniref:TlpA family protein disulfide reductase n=1 Tax=Putridiphycobacter roseus TaxID=2219161 RepID=A0A2W1N3B3_9FLAO|nr:TlpA disulfide reductase family protein [Putridiphycobacter roseus]PZE18807.1 TlpA family protein disulfide reductase [Putridiphycobacter roseus]